MNATQTLRCPLEFEQDNERFCYQLGKCKFPHTRENCPDLNRYLLTHKEFRTPEVWARKYARGERV